MPDPQTLKPYVNERPTGWFTAYDAEGIASLSTHSQADALARVKLLTTMGGRWATAQTLCAKIESLESELATLRAASAGQLIDPSETVPRLFQ